MPQSEKRPLSLKPIFIAVCFIQSFFLLVFSNYFITSRDETFHGADKISKEPLQSASSSEKSPPSSNKSMPDPEGLDCKQLLKDYRNGKVREMERAPGGWEKSFVTRTDTKNPFYWSLHDPQLDSARKTSFRRGVYYESALSDRIIEVFEANNARNVESDLGKKESIFLDVGGNIGWFSLLAAAHGATKVYTFEPNPANLIRFCESLVLNDWLRDDRGQDMVIPIAKGVGQESAKKKLYRIDDNNPGTYSFSEAWVGKFKRKSEMNHDDSWVDEIEIVTLDSFARSHGWLDSDDASRPSIAFFKLDVEGYEPEIVFGAKELFKSRIVENFEMEIKKKMSSNHKKDIIEILFNSGYELVMHGLFKGPNTQVTKKYNNHSDLSDEICNGKYGENVLFRKRKDWKK